MSRVNYLRIPVYDESTHFSQVLTAGKSSSNRPCLPVCLSVRHTLGGNIVRNRDSNFMNFSENISWCTERRCFFFKANYQVRMSHRQKKKLVKQIKCRVSGHSQENSLKFGVRIYPGRPNSWSLFGQSLLIFRILAGAFRLSETDQIYGFRLWKTCEGMVWRKKEGTVSN